MMIQFDYSNIFSMGWNHQLELLVMYYWFEKLEGISDGLFWKSMRKSDLDFFSGGRGGVGYT